MLDGPNGSELRALRAPAQELKQVPPRAVTILAVVSGWKSDAERWLFSVFKHTTADFEVLMLDDSGDPSIGAWLDSRAAERLRVLRFDPPVGFAAAVNAGIEAATGEACVLFDTSVELTGDAISPLVDAFKDPSVVVAGPFGLRATSNLKEFEAAPGPQVEAIEGYCLAFRRADAVAAGLLDPKFRFYRIADIDFSFRLRDHGNVGVAWVVRDLPLTRHEHRLWENTPAAERDRLSKRNFYRFLDRWRMREDLLVHD